MTHLLVRMGSVDFFMLIPIIFGVMIPMTLQYVLPIATGASVYMVLGGFAQRHEKTFFFFSRSAQYVVLKAIIIFSLVITVFYAFLIFEWVPKSYTYGKKALISLAEQQFLHYEPYRVHKPLPGLQLIFQERTSLRKDVYQLHHIFLSFKQHKRHLFFTADYGLLTGSVLLLKHGSLLDWHEKNHTFASFDQISFDLKTVLTQEKKKTTLSKPSLRHAAWHDFMYALPENFAVRIEMHKRCGQVLWQLLLPIIILLYYFFVTNFKSVILESFIVSGALFLAMYIFLMLGHVCGGSLGLLFFYLPQILITSYGAYRYQRFS